MKSDALVIQGKLESLARCVHRIQDQYPVTAEELRQNYDKQDIVVLNIERAVQLCVDIGGIVLSAIAHRVPDTMGQTFSLLQEAGVIDGTLAASMRSAVGFRNVAVHQSSTLDMDIVSRIASKSMEDFCAFARAVMDWLGRGVCAE